MEYNILNISEILGGHNYPNMPIQPRLCVMYNGELKIIKENEWTEELTLLVNEWNQFYILVDKWRFGDKTALDFDDNSEEAISIFVSKWACDMLNRHKKAYIRNTNIDNILK